MPTANFVRTCVLAACAAVLCGAATAQAGYRVYTHLFEPREHPDYDRRHVQPPSWEVFGNVTQFAALRGFGVENDQIVGYVEEIEKYTKVYELGNVIWPAYPIIFAKNLGDLADETERRGLYLFDIWGYVPGSGPGGYWQQFHPDTAVFEMLESKLGERWLGMDNGEQDGRYIGGYASQMSGISDNRFDAYLNFQRHFERMGDELGNKLSTLVSLNFGHYFLKEGIYASIGAETAQALPNSQVYYAFIRGAGKQYGVPWFGNASVWNRWGYKAYGTPGDDHSPTKGTSLNLLKRLLYSHILYNCVFVGFESAWFDGDALSPVGRIQQAAQRWVKEHGQPGVMQTPVALLLDFYSGWSFPRHLYTDNLYRVWGSIPYAPGDYFADGVLDMLYPGYQDASYFHDETGFLTPTPYGDIADCLLSDAPGWLLARYPLIIVAGELQAGTETEDKLRAYVEQGGHLVITAGNLTKMPEFLPGLAAGSESVLVRADTDIVCGDSTLRESQDWWMRGLTLPEQSRVLAKCGNFAVAAQISSGKGRVTALASEFGVPMRSSASYPIANEVDKPLAKPYALLQHVQHILGAAIHEQELFGVGEGLGLSVCRKEPGLYTLGVFNNGLTPRPFRITSRIGEIEAVTELPLDQSEKGAPGYLPEGSENAAVGVSTESEIAGGDVRIFSVRVREENVGEIPHIAPPPRPKGRLLPLRGQRMLKEEILARPTFFEHFDGVLLDWRYLDVRAPEALQQESGWLERQGLDIWVDLSSGINLYPGLRLVNNDPAEYEASINKIKGILDKMPILGARNLVLSLHRTPENNITHEETQDSFVNTLRAMSECAAAQGTTIHLRMSMKAVTSVGEAAQILDRVNAPNLRIATSTALIMSQGNEPDYVREQLGNRLGLWLASAPANDGNGRLWTVHGSLAEDATVCERLKTLLATTPEVPIALDAVFDNREEEYRDIRMLERVHGE